jgi:hypothetical protein
MHSQSWSNRYYCALPETSMVLFTSVINWTNRVLSLSIIGVWSRGRRNRSRKSVEGDRDLVFAGWRLSGFGVCD